MNFRASFVRRHPWLSAVTGCLFLALLMTAWHARGPFHDYRADLIRAPQGGSSHDSGDLRVGVAKEDITPDLSHYDAFIDRDGDGKYEPEQGDSFQDTNLNGKVDAVWMAGFGNDRPAKGVHDPLWARAIAFENNGVRLVLVTVDSIGLFHEAVVDMRQRLNASSRIDHLVVSSLHDHEAPDTMGLWSIGLERPYLRFDHAYLEQVKCAVVKAAEQAIAGLTPADTFLGERSVGPEGFVDDSRKPVVYDRRLRCARFVKKGTSETIAVIAVWGNHPETLASDNSLITSDFCHYFREGVEKGIGPPGGAPGLGGMCLYFQGMVGGLMTQLHTTVPHRNSEQKFRSASFEKAQALGENLAMQVLDLYQGSQFEPMKAREIAIVARSVFLSPKPLFRFLIALGFLHPGWYGWGQAKTEVDALRIGEIEILTIPGELYPEIGEGGIESPEGQDFPVSPVEVPPLRQQMKGKLNLIIGLANDEIGYIIPKSQWDAKKPYAYGRTGSPQYGEENSFGPEVAPAIHQSALRQLQVLHQQLSTHP
jgi:hypothetical protein